MRSTWVDSGNDPAYGLYPRYGITVPFFDPRDPRVTASYLDGVLAHPQITQCGIYTAWNWGSFSAEEYAEWTDAQLRRINWQGNAWVFLDIEKGHGVNDSNFVSYAAAALKRWRQLRPSRKTWWTLEGMQGGLFSGNQATTIDKLNIPICPQFFMGDMNPQPHSPIIDLQEVGFTKIDGMYDAAQLPAIWRGCAFTQGRLKP
jgi:hypothetical protein